MELTVVVCTLDRRASLLRGLESLARQVSEGAWEVVVVDNGSSDGSGKAAAALDFPVPLRVVVEPERGLSRARNSGLEVAVGAACAFVDDDMTLRPGWVQAYVEAFRDPEVAGAGGRIHPVLPPETPAWFEALMETEVAGPSGRYDFGDAPAPIVLGGSIRTPFGGNMAARRDLARELGGFRLDLGWGVRRIPGEEKEFFGRLLAAGHRLRYCPTAEVDHHVQPSHVTLEHCLRWQEGSGRAKLIRTPPAGTLDRTGKAGKALYHMARRWWRARRAGDELARVEARLRLARKRGRLLELLGR